MNSDKMKEAVSFEYIEQITLGDLTSTRELLLVYVKQNNQNVRELQEHLLLQNWQALAKLAHKLKSSLALLGLTARRALAEQLEKTAGQNIAETHEMVNELVRATKDAISEVEKKLKSL